MAKLKVDIEGKDYLLELDRSSIRWGEKIGFDLNKFTSEPITQTQLIWAMGLHKHHPSLPLDKLFKLFDDYDKEEGDFEPIYKFLTEQYQSFILATQESSEKKKQPILID